MTVTVEVFKRRGFYDLEIKHNDFKHLSRKGIGMAFLYATMKDISVTISNAGDYAVLFEIG